MFIMIDGIDGSGKSTMMQTYVQTFIEQGKQIFDLTNWSKQTGRLPTFSEIRGADVLVSAEPTYVWTGAMIRQELCQEDRAYHPREVASAFSLDRLVLYKKCYLPALASNIIILADRGLSSSLVYQTVNGDITPEELLELNGNKLALKYAPTHLIIADIKPEEAKTRLKNRTNKQDDCAFETLEFMKKCHKAYNAKWFQTIFQNQGTEIHKLDTSGNLEKVKINTLALLKKIFPS